MLIGKGRKRLARDEIDTEYLFDIVVCVNRAIHILGIIPLVILGSLKMFC
jgi:hypothetical protein